MSHFPALRRIRHPLRDLDGSHQSDRAARLLAQLVEELCRARRALRAAGSRRVGHYLCRLRGASPPLHLQVGRPSTALFRSFPRLLIPLPMQRLDRLHS